MVREVWSKHLSKPQCLFFRCQLHCSLLTASRSLLRCIASILCFSFWLLLMVAGWSFSFLWFLFCTVSFGFAIIYLPMPAVRKLFFLLFFSLGNFLRQQLVVDLLLIILWWLTNDDNGNTAKV